jgi:2-oxoglutarate dehydrogenase E2 component (dihydrolipoamide succinyltransferase)
VAVNAPEAGTIKEFLANEEDTVTVGQDLVRLELGGAPSGGKEKGDSEPKEPASKDQSTSSDPEPSKKEESKPKDESSPPPPSQEKKPEPKKEPPPPKQSESKKTDSKPSSSAPTFGSREERRVSRML